MTSTRIHHLHLAGRPARTRWTIAGSLVCAAEDEAAGSGTFHRFGQAVTQWMRASSDAGSVSPPNHRRFGGVSRSTRRLAQLCTLCLVAFAEIASADVPLALFDQGHGQRFVVERAGALDLSGLASLFMAQGFQVRATQESLTRERLAGAAVLVISGPFAPLAPAEVEAIGRFVRDGGRLCLMLHIAPSFEGLLASLGVSASRGVINKQEDRIDGRPLDFRVTKLAKHPLTEGLTGFTVHGAWAVSPAGEGAKVVAQTGPGAWIDLDRDRRRSEAEPAQSLGVAVAGELGQGRFVVFGDDALFQNQFLLGENRELGKSLVRWLSAVGL